VAFLDQRPNMKRSIDPFFSASRGTLVGDLLWLGAIGFIIAIITGMIG
jgi:preprotein translocase subunit Sss1